MKAGRVNRVASMSFLTTNLAKKVLLGLQKNLVLHSIEKEIAQKRIEKQNRLYFVKWIRAQQLQITLGRFSEIMETFYVNKMG